eukprot:767365-Hanusia_phi.AAC.9
MVVLGAMWSRSHEPSQLPCARKGGLHQVHRVLQEVRKEGQTEAVPLGRGVPSFQQAQKVRGASVKVAPCRSALRAHPACPDQRGPRFVHNRRGSGPVVMVKNEELVASTATALEYLSLVKGNRGRMGSMRFRWARHAGGECYRLKDIASELAKDIFYDINRCDGEVTS